MAIAEIGGKEFDIPDSWTPEETQKNIFGQFPELDPNRSVLKSGIAKGLKAFSDVVETGTKVLSTAAALAPELALGAPIDPEIALRRKQTVQNAFADDNKSRRAFWDKVIEETSPVIDSEKSALSVLKVAASDAIGLALETPLFVAGGGVGASAAKFIPGAGKFAQAVRSMISTGAAFGGESALRGQEIEEVLKSTATGAVVGPAGSLAPRGLKTIAEASALLGAAKVFSGQEINMETWATVLATLVELKLLHKVTGQAIGGGKAVAQAVQRVREKGEITDAQVTAILKEVKILDETSERAVNEEIAAKAPEGSSVKEAPVEAKVKAEALPVEEGKIDINAREVGDTVHYMTEKGEVIRSIIIKKDADKLGSAKGFSIELPDGRIIEARPSAIEPTPDLIKARQARQRELDEKTALQERIKQAPLGKKKAITKPTEEPSEAKKQELMQQLDELGQEVERLGDFALPEAKAEILGKQRILMEQLFGKDLVTKEFAASDKRRLERRVAVSEVPVEKRSKERRIGETEEQTAERLEKDKAKNPKPLGQRNPDQAGVIDIDLLIPKKVKAGALKLGQDIRNVMNVAKELNKARIEQGESDLDIEQVKFNTFYKVGLTLLQIADLNPKVTGLQDYVSWTRAWSNNKRNDMHVADIRLKEWNGLGKEDSKKLMDVLFRETNDGKKLTPEELAKSGISEEAQILKLRIAEDFQSFIKEVETSFLTDAARTLEGRQLLAAQQAIKEDFAILKNKPYFPLMRWGKYVVTVRDKEGNVLEFHARETKTTQTLLWAQLRRRSRAKGFTVSRGYVSDELMAFQGMPPRLVDKLTTELRLSEEQREMLDNLQHKLSPSQSWRKHLLSRKGIKGYSEDAMRAYASYFFHGANHLARLKYGDKLLTSIGDVRRRASQLSKAGFDSRDQDRLAEFMDQHYKYIMSPKNELAALRAFGFVWYLGFLPKAAFINLTQVPLVAYPHLASRFGDAGAVAEIARSYKSMSRSLAGRRKSLTDDEIKAMDRYLEDGITDESFAATLAGVAEGSTLSRLLPQTKGGRTVADVAGKGAYLFSMAEQLNRRVTALAAYRLARKSGSDHEAAYAVGRDAVEKTQFEYANWNRPQFMRGKTSVIFLFYQFLQNMLYFAARDPGNLRYLGMLFAASGISGLPFMEDLLDVVDRSFGTKNKKFDSRKELREFVSELGANPDLLMHGGSRYGLGLPWLARQVSLPIPDFDVSASISMGRPLRVTEPMLNVTGDFSRNFPEAFQNAGGALLSIPMEAWKLIDSNQPWTLKRLENVMPSIGRSMSKAYRRARDGIETTSGGVEVAKFDLTDPEDLTGIGMQALGFASTKVSERFEGLYTMREVVTFYNERRRELLNYVDHAYSTGDQDAIKDTLKAVARYNREVPYKQLSISGQDLVQSKLTKALKRRKEQLGLPEGNLRNAEIMREYSKAFPKRGE